MLIPLFELCVHCKINKLEVILNVLEVVTSTPKLVKPVRVENQPSENSTNLENNGEENGVNFQDDTVDICEFLDPLPNPLTPAVPTAVNVQKFDGLEPPSFLADKSELDIDSNKFVPPLNLMDGSDDSEKIDKQEKEQGHKKDLHYGADQIQGNLPLRKSVKVSPVQTPSKQNSEDKAGGSQSPCLIPAVGKKDSISPGEFEVAFELTNNLLTQLLTNLIIELACFWRTEHLACFWRTEYFTRD